MSSKKGGNKTRNTDPLGKRSSRDQPVTVRASFCVQSLAHSSVVLANPSCLLCCCLHTYARELPHKHIFPSHPFPMHRLHASLPRFPQARNAQHKPRNGEHRAMQEKKKNNRTPAINQHCHITCTPIGPSSLPHFQALNPAHGSPPPPPPPCPCCPCP